MSQSNVLPSSISDDHTPDSMKFVHCTLYHLYHLRGYPSIATFRQKRGMRRCSNLPKRRPQGGGRRRSGRSGRMQRAFNLPKLGIDKPPAACCNKINLPMLSAVNSEKGRRPMRSSLCRMGSMCMHFCACASSVMPSDSSPMQCCSRPD